MKQRIRRFDPLQVAKMMGVMYLLMGLLFVPILLLINSFAPSGQSFGTVFAVVIPLAYGAAGFVFGGIGAAIYNMVAGWVGGIEIELEAPPA